MIAHEAEWLIPCFLMVLAVAPLLILAMKWVLK